MKYLILALGTTMLGLFSILAFDDLTANGILLESRDLVNKTAWIVVFIFVLLKLYPYIHPYLIIKDDEYNKDNEETKSD